MGRGGDGLAQPAVPGRRHPATLAPLAATPGLIDEYLLVVHPAVIDAGPQLFEQVPTDLALRLVEAKAFDGGAVVLRYAVLAS